MELVYPGFLAPIPATAVVEIMPDLEEGSLKQGVVIARGSPLKTPLGKGERTSCEFRTSQDVTLWPLTVTDAKYLSGTGAVSGQGPWRSTHRRALRSACASRARVASRSRRYPSTASTFI